MEVCKAARTFRPEGGAPATESRDQNGFEEEEKSEGLIGFSSQFPVLSLSVRLGTFHFELCIEKYSSAFILSMTSRP